MTLTRERLIDLIAGIVLLLCELFDPEEKDYAIAEIFRVVRARRSKRRSARMRTPIDDARDFTREEAPTDPSAPPAALGPRDTRRNNVGEILGEIDRRSSKPPKP